jgi:hypothetical protein
MGELTLEIVDPTAEYKGQGSNERGKRTILKIAIQDLTPGLVKGVEVRLPTAQLGYRETYFEWTPSSLVA